MSRRYRLFGSGQVVDCYVLRTFMFMALIQWNVRESWDGNPPFNDYTKVCWRPRWRLL